MRVRKTKMFHHVVSNGLRTFPLQQPQLSLLGKVSRKIPFKTVFFAVRPNTPALDIVQIWGEISLRQEQIQLKHSQIQHSAFVLQAVMLCSSFMWLLALITALVEWTCDKQMSLWLLLYSLLPLLILPLSALFYANLLSWLVPCPMKRARKWSWDLDCSLPLWRSSSSTSPGSSMASSCSSLQPLATLAVLSAS